jgi:lysozyme family protein
MDNSIDNSIDNFTANILPVTLGYEGGVDLNEVGDSGISNFGVTQKAWDAYTTQNKIKGKGSVKDLKYGDVRDFAYNEYYKKPKLDTLPNKVSGVLFDYAYNSGAGRAVKTLQEIVETVPDGIIGKKTREAVDNYIKENGEDTLISGILDNREAFLSDLLINNPEKYGKFAEGWANRMSSLRDKYSSQ